MNYRSRLRPNYGKLWQYSLWNWLVKEAVLAEQRRHIPCCQDQFVIDQPSWITRGLMQCRGRGRCEVLGIGVECAGDCVQESERLRAVRESSSGRRGFWGT